jgi:hypothetical protein
VRTRNWTTPSDVVVQNVEVAYKGGAGTFSAVYDSTNTQTALATYSNGSLDWDTAPLLGTACNSVAFGVVGTSTTSAHCGLYGISWDAIIEPKRVKFLKTDYDEAGTPNEKVWDVHYADVEAFGAGSVLGTVFIDGTAVMTATIASPTAGRQTVKTAFPTATYGNLRHTVYNASTGVVFKHFASRCAARPEPDRVATVTAGPWTFPSDQNLETWVADINPLGIVTGTLFVDGTAVSTSTFSGGARQVFNVGLDLDAALTPSVEGRTLHVVYNGVFGLPLKHYDTKIVTTPKPFGKTTWHIDYRKAGGATQLDMPRFWALDAETQSGTATITSIWDVDGTALTTQTLTLVGRQWQDRLRLPAGARGYLFRQRLIANAPIEVFRSSLDIERVGIKGLSRVSVAGKPIAE